jgi:hypothetical protein
MSRRVRLGTQADGTIALRVSQRSFDALTAVDDGHAITFDSRWTDIARIHQIGFVSWAASAFPFSSQATTLSNGFIAFWPGLGYKPFCEVHRLSGSVVRDDYWNASFTSGCYAAVFSDHFTAVEDTATSDKALYVVYKIPVPSQ